MRSISEAHIQICQSEVNLLFSLLANHSSASWPAAEREREVRKTTCKETEAEDASIHGGSGNERPEDS